MVGGICMSLLLPSGVKDDMCGGAGAGGASHTQSLLIHPQIAFPRNNNTKNTRRLDDEDEEIIIKGPPDHKILVPHCNNNLIILQQHPKPYVNILDPHFIITPTPSNTTFSASTPPTYTTTPSPHTTHTNNNNHHHHHNNSSSSDIPFFDFLGVGSSPHMNDMI